MKWDLLDRRVYDAMVSVLLSRLHPTLRRVDGAGGDEGRDCEFTDEAGRHVYQLKSFTGRITSQRRTQIKRSLRRAAEHSPADWTVVVPIDQTPAEERWFYGLRDAALFPIEWRGLTWLDAEMSKHPDIERYFLTDGRDEVLRLLKELRQENAQIESVAEMEERVRNLHTRLNETDPYYRYTFAMGAEAAASRPDGAVLSVDHGDFRVDVWPLYRGAEVDRPITVTAQLMFGSDDAETEEAFEQHLDFGTPVTLSPPVVTSIEIDAPAGLGGRFDRGVLEIGAPRSAARRIRFTAELSHDGRILGAIPLDLEPQGGGRKGGILVGGDALCGWFKVRLTIDVSARRYRANLKIDPSPAAPAAVLPLLRWLAQFHAPNKLALRSTLWSNASAELLEHGTSLDPVYVRVVEALDNVQRLSGVNFDLPMDLTPAEGNEILIAEQLLLGEQIRGRWTKPITMDLRPAPEVRSALQPLIQGNEVALILERDENLVIRKHAIPLGRIRLSVRAAKARDATALAEQLSSERAEIHLELVPGGSDATIRQRRPPTSL